MALGGVTAAVVPDVAGTVTLVVRDAARRNGVTLGPVGPLTGCSTAGPKSSACA
ncbi:hypothetical protein JS756_12265 [Streptomyces actuosus]|uniref:Uncharacterized protein n=1 Tax=Streptomyces actuosus TaxID=1885 RepID=A0ABS2VP49_STRAS|nr:hypothetical protein [Streptomyces actuosus]MBN0044867.1 hypothetical protein [Streptomyces actuosus]